MFEAKLDLLQMPKGVAGWRAPRIASDEDIARLTEAKAALDALLAAAETYAQGGPGTVIDIAHLDAPSLEILDQILGQGEVQATLENGSRTRIQEAVMPGLWRVHGEDVHYLEVGDVPEMLRQVADTGRAELAIPPALPEGAMNVLPVLAEIRDTMGKVRRGEKTREINLTLLPMTPVDLNVLAEALGLGRVTILSRGYGNCRITACACRGVWRISYFNSDDKMILDVVEVGDIPAAALAAREDLADSADRLRQVIKAYWP
ncbi:hydrogenase expression/formation protein [Telmatospirillum sp. J64-1]|uniref:hydrogenase expression/formation protein n=1 Tax=Telmatospirillum sp. J64-1 TaxID=2502183 RepID=UPI00115D09B9|nr:hydrogenase expression/formation protein [Telmatospirillum sp. J64-1]